MADKFKTHVEFAVTTDDDVWHMTGYLASYVGLMLRSLVGHTRGPEFTLHDGSGSSIDRKTLDDIRAAAREHHLAAESLWVHYRFKRNLVALSNDASDLERLTFEMAIDLHPDIEVSVRSRFTAQWNGTSVAVNIESNDKLLLDGLQAKLVAERDHIAAGDDTSALPPTQVSAITPVEVGSTPPVQSPPPVTTKTATRNWFATTWRDHTALLIVTVIGGLVVATGSVWLGIR